MTARSVEVWPAGIPAASWDDEGFGEWITSEPIFIGMRADHDVYRLEIEAESSASEPMALDMEPGKESFFSLPSKFAGVQRIRVLAYSDGGELPAIGHLTARTRDPRDWSLDKNCGAPLWIEERPSSPTMEQLWEGDAAILVHGPQGLHLQIRLSLLNGRGRTIFERRLEAKSPLKKEGWNEVLARFRSEPRAQRHYDAARALGIEIDAGHFGYHRVTIERESNPLRWLVQTERDRVELQLLDNTGRPKNAQVWRSDFARPAIQEQISSELAVAGFDVPEEGGLFFTTDGDASRGVVISPSRRLKGFHELRTVPTIDLPSRSVTGLRSLIAVAARWSSARLSGDLASALRRDEVLTRILQRIFGLIGGERWEQGELAFSQTNRNVEGLAGLVGKNSTERRFAASLLKEVPSMTRLTTPERVATFSEITLRDLAVPSGGYLESCLRLASLAHGLRCWGGASSESVTKWLLDNPVVARGARLVVLGVDRLPDTARATLGRPHSNWEW